MSGYNERHGLKRAGKRSMMKLPDDRDLRAKLTSAKCPSCDRTGARLSKARPITIEKFRLPSRDHADGD